MEDSPHLTEIRRVITAVSAITDPVDRARAVGAVLDAVPDLQAELRRVRQEAVLALRETRTTTEIGRILGLSQPRVSQIAQGISRSAKR